MSGAPQPSQLDSAQVLRHSFDDVNGRLRVETAATIVAGAVEVALDASTDSIAIKDPNSGFALTVNADGSLNVVTNSATIANVNLHDASGNPLTSTGGALNVNSNSTITGTVLTKEAGSDDFKTSQYTIGLSVVQLAPVAIVGRTSLSIRVDKSNTGAVYIGNSNAVTTSTGYPLFAGDTLGMDLSDSKSVYAIADTANQKIALLEIS